MTYYKAISPFKRMQLYRDFLANCIPSSKSVSNYSQFTRIDGWVKTKFPTFKGVISIDTEEEATDLYNELDSWVSMPDKKKTHQTFKQIGGGQYHNALLMYIRFLHAMKLGGIIAKSSYKHRGNMHFCVPKEWNWQTIFYGAPGTGKSYAIHQLTEGQNVIRTTFHPNSDYSTFVGAYKPTMGLLPIFDELGQPMKIGSTVLHKEQITYEFVEQAFLQAYIQAWKKVGRSICTHTSASPSKVSGAPTSPYKVIEAGMPLASFKRTPLNDYDIDETEEKLLCEVDAALMSFMGVVRFNDIHERLTVYIDNQEAKLSITITFHRDEVEKELAELEELYGADCFNDNTFPGQRYLFLKVIYDEMISKGLSEIQKTFSDAKSIWGKHYFEGERECIKIYKGQIIEDLRSIIYAEDDVHYAVVATYVHEMFHAFYKTRCKVKEIEEAIVECSTLCLLELMAKNNPNKYQAILKFYEDEITRKKRTYSFSYYGFGHYLYQNRSIDWINLYKNAQININSNDVHRYIKMFNGCYVASEDSTMQLLYNILTTQPSLNHITSDENVFLIIEEINRGNCAQIFGDLFQLLDRNDYGFSVYPINADKDIKKYLAQEFDGISICDADNINQCFNDRDVVKEVLAGDILLLPNNLYIWATMNTSDQSLFPIDSAFKRRWKWKYIPIEQAEKGLDGEPRKWKIEADGHYCYWWEFLQAINDEIEDITHSEDKQLGYYFCKPESGEYISANDFVSKVIFYLWNDVFKDEDSSIFQYEELDGNWKVEDYRPKNDRLYFRSFISGRDTVDEKLVRWFINNLLNKKEIPLLDDAEQNPVDEKEIAYMRKQKTIAPDNLEPEDLEDSLSEDETLKDEVQHIASTTP